MQGSDTIKKQTAASAQLAQDEKSPTSESSVREVGGETYAATSVLAQEFGYDADHIGRLARQGRVRSIREDKRWFVSRGSLEAYKKVTEIQRRVRAFESVQISKEVPENGLLRKPITVPSLALFHIAERIRASRINLRPSPRGLGLILLALFIFWSASAHEVSKQNAHVPELLPAKHSDFSNDLERSRQAFAEPLMAFVQEADIPIPLPLTKGATVQAYTWKPLLAQLEGFNGYFLNPIDRAMSALVRTVDQELATGSNYIPQVLSWIPNRDPRPIAIKDPQMFGKEKLAYPRVGDFESFAHTAVKDIEGGMRKGIAKNQIAFMSGPQMPRREPSQVSFSLNVDNPVENLLGWATDILVHRIGSIADNTYVAHKIFLQQQSKTAGIAAIPRRTPARPAAIPPPILRASEQLGILSYVVKTPDMTLPLPVKERGSLLAQLEAFNGYFLNPIDRGMAILVKAVDRGLGGTAWQIHTAWTNRGTTKTRIAIKDPHSFGKRTLAGPQVQGFESVAEEGWRSLNEGITHFKTAPLARPVLPSQTQQFSLGFGRLALSFRNIVQGKVGTLADQTYASHRTFWSQQASLSTLFASFRKSKAPAPIASIKSPSILRASNQTTAALPRLFPLGRRRPTPTPSPAGTPTPSASATFSQRQINELNTLIRRYVGSAITVNAPPVSNSVREELDAIKGSLLSLQQRVPFPLQYTGNNHQVGLSSSVLTVDNVRIDGNAITATSGVLELPAALKLGNVSYTWPGADGTANQALSTDGNGVLTWTTISGGGASLSLNETVTGAWEFRNNASVSALFGSAFPATDCSAESQNLLWNSTTGRFSCGADAGGAGGAEFKTEESGAQILSTTTILNFDGGKFTLAASGSIEARINLDWGSGGPASRSADQTIAGAWRFTAASNQFTNTLEIGTASISILTLGTPLTDASIADAITINWTGLQNYPTGCTNQFVTTIGDTLTCASVNISGMTNLSVTATGLALSGDAITLMAGFNIPLTASTSNWETFRDIPSTRITAGTGFAWSGNTFGADTGFTMPLTASQTAWELFRDTPSTRITAGTNLSWSTNTLNVSGLQPLDATLTALAGTGGSNGLLTVTGSNSFAARTITGTTNKIDVSNGNGVSGNPTLTLADNLSLVNASGSFFEATTGKFGTLAVDSGRILISNNATASLNFEVVGYASASSLFGAGLTNCSDESQTLNWSSSTGRFSCLADGGGGGSGVKTEEGGTQNLAAATTLNFEGNMFTLAASGSTESIVRLDWTNGPASRAANEQITGLWRFTAASGQFANALEIGTASVSALFGAGLTDCDAGAGNKALNWSGETGLFSCTDDDAGGGGGALIEVREGFSGSGTNVSSVSFEGGSFAVSFSGTEALVRLDWGAAGPASLSEAETIAGNWVNIANPWADDEVSDTLTVGSGGSVNDAALSVNVAHVNAAETITSLWEFRSGASLSGGATGLLVDLDSTGDFIVKRGGTTYLTITDAGLFTFDNITLDTTTIGTTSGNLTLNSAGTLDVQDDATFASTLTTTGLATFSGGASSSTGFEITTGNLGINAGPITSARLEVGGTASISGVATFGSTLGVSGATTLSSTLDVTGQTTLANASVSSNFEVGTSDFFVNTTGIGVNTSNLSVALEVVGLASISDDIRINGNDIQDSTGASRLNLATGFVDFNDDIEVSGNDIRDSGQANRITFDATNGLISLTGRASVSGTFEAAGGTVKATVYSGDSAITFGNASTGTTIAGSGLTISPTSWTATPTISGLITATSGLTANGLATFSGGVSVSTNFELTGNTRLGINVINTNQTLEIGGTASISGAVTLSGAVTGATGYNGLVITPNTGVITTGTWNGSVITPAFGGTGVANNAASTLTISGNFATTLTVSGVTSVTLPTAGTLAILGANTFTGLQTFSAGASVGANLELTGNFRLGINPGGSTDTSLEVGGAASISGNFTQAGASTFTTGTGAIALNGPVTAALTFTNTGLATFNGGVSVSTNFELTGNTRLGINAGGTTNTNLEVGGTASISGATTFGSTIGVTGATTLSSTLGVTGLATFTNASTSSNFEVVGYASISQFYLQDTDGGTFSDCDGTANKVTYDLTNRKFNCEADQNSGGSSSPKGISVRETGGTFSHIGSLSFESNIFLLSNTASESVIDLDWSNAGAPASRSLANTWTQLQTFTLGASSSANFEVVGNASVSALFGSAFSSIGSNCNTETQTLNWNSTTGKFSCLTDDTGGGSSFSGLDFGLIGGSQVKITSISFEANHFNISNTASEGFVRLDWTNGPASRAFNETITGFWKFTAASTQLTGLELSGFASISINGLDFNLNLKGTGDFIIQDAGTTVFTITDDGKVAFTTNASASVGDFNIFRNSARAFTIQDAGGDDDILQVDTTASASNPGLDINSNVSEFAAGNSALTITVLASSSRQLPHGVLWVQDSNSLTLASMSNAGRLGIRGSINSHAGGSALCTGVSAPNPGCVDYAEAFPTSDSTLTAGEIVSADLASSQYVNRAVPGSLPLGVVSTNPAALITGTKFAYGAEALEHLPPGHVPIALAGRVPVKVSTENGPIKVGDYLTNSATRPGVAMRASKAGRVIGQALENYNDQKNIGTILLFINNTYYSGRIENSGLMSDLGDTQSILTALLKQDPDQEIPSQVVTDLIVANKEIIASRISANNLSIVGLAYLNELRALKIVADEIDSPALELMDNQLAVLANSVYALNSQMALTGEQLMALASNSWNPREDIALNAGLSVEGSAVFNGGLTVDRIGSEGNLVLFNSDVEFFGRPYFNNDTGGFLVVSKGATYASVSFEREYLNQPVVNTTISLNTASASEADEQLLFDSDIRYIVTNKNVKGFTVKLNKPAPFDIQFSWIALAIKDAKTVFSPRPSLEATEGTAIDAIAPSATPSATPEFSLEPTPESTQESTPAPSVTPEPSVEPTLEPVAESTPEPSISVTPEITPIPSISSEPTPEISTEPTL
ncbi:MAG: hypothetical protein AAB479_01570 [Patescibacteria group bacterium]